MREKVVSQTPRPKPVEIRVFHSVLRDWLNNPNSQTIKCLPGIYSPTHFYGVDPSRILEEIMGEDRRTKKNKRVDCKNICRS